MARIYYCRNGRVADRSGQRAEASKVVEYFHGYRTEWLGVLPPERSGVPLGPDCVALVEVGPDDIQAPEFLDLGFYAMS